MRTDPQKKNTGDDPQALRRFTLSRGADQRLQPQLSNSSMSIIRPSG